MAGGSTGLDDKTLYCRALELRLTLGSSPEGPDT